MFNDERLDMGSTAMDPQDMAIEAFETALAHGASEPEALRFAIAAYPTYADLLADYSLSVKAAREIEDSEELSAIEARILNRSKVVLDERLKLAAAKRDQISGILAAAAFLGQNATQLSESIGLARSVITKLDRRLIDAASIPPNAIKRIAGAICCPSDYLRAYLSGKPTLSLRANYTADSAPNIADEAGQVRQELFDKALDEAISYGEMTPDQASQWRYSQ